MNIITADFNWISFLIVVIGAVIGVVKSNRRSGEHEPPVVQEPIFTFDDEDEPEYDTECRSESEIPAPDSLYEELSEEIEKPNSIQPEPEKEMVPEKPLFANEISTQNEEEEGSEISRQFDIRQAIISSEILNHPHF